MTVNIENAEHDTSTLPVITLPEILMPEGIALPASHRCDRCGVQAWVEVETPFIRVVKHINPIAHEEVSEPDTAVTLLCAHHYNEHEDKIKESAVKIIDYRTTLQAQEKGGLRGAST